MKGGHWAVMAWLSFHYVDLCVFDMKNACVRILFGNKNNTRMLVCLYFHFLSLSLPSIKIKE